MLYGASNIPHGVAYATPESYRQARKPSASIIVSLRDGLILRGVSPLELPTKGEAVGGYTP